MGKLSDAMERHKKERDIKTEMIPITRTDQVTKEEAPVYPLENKVTSTVFDNKLVTLTAPESFAAESFKALRAQILFAKDTKRPRTIMVTSAMPGDGKTFVAANLAASIAMGIDEYVLLVDCDLRKSDLPRMFGLSNNPGLHEYLKKEKELPELLIKTRIDKLSILPAGSTPRNPSELLSSGAMKAFLKEVRDRYDDRFIILDTAPSQVLTEANVIANFVDGIVFVVLDSKTPRNMVRKATEHLGKDKVLGIVYNGYSQSYKSYGKYYNKYYS